MVCSAKTTEVIMMRNADMPVEDVANITVYEVLNYKCGATNLVGITFIKTASTFVA